MHKRTILFITAILIFLLAPALVFSGESLKEKLSGHILLQVESRGEAWYVNPEDNKRYYLKAPREALQIIRQLGQGITDQKLKKIPIGIMETDLYDSDNDGLKDSLEETIGTDPNKKDSDSDGYNDLVEIQNNYSPTGAGKMPVDEDFSQEKAGKIFLQVENHGEAWYVNPQDGKRYFLNRPRDALRIMKKMGLGIKTKDLRRIDKNVSPVCRNCNDVGRSTSSPSEDFENNYTSDHSTSSVSNDNNKTSTSSTSTCYTCEKTPKQVLRAAANTINQGNAEEAKKYFLPDYRKSVEHTINFLDENGRFSLANIMQGAEKTSSGYSEAVFTNSTYFGWVGQEIEIEFKLKKQDNGGWLLANL